MPCRHHSGNSNIDLCTWPQATTNKSKLDFLSTHCFYIYQPEMWPPVRVCVTILPFKAMTLLVGFIMALSAEMGLLNGLVGSDMSTITTWFWSPTFSLMQMNLSDSMVR